MKQKLVFVLVFFCLSAGVLFATESDEDFQKGLQAYHRQDYANAQNLFKTALAADATNWKAAQMLGSSDIRLNQMDQGVADFTLSLQIKPDNPELVKYLDQIKSLVDASHYTWDPGVDPYPRFTGIANPLVPVKISILPKVYVTAAYSMGSNNLIEGPGYNSMTGTTSYTAIPLRLHYELNSILSLAAGVEFWSNINSQSFHQYNYSSTSSDSEAATISYQVTPVTLELFVHHWEKGFAVDCGAGLMGCFYQSSYLNEEVEKSGSNNDVYSNKETVNGLSLGGVAEINISWILDEENHFAIFATGEGYAAGVSGYGNGSTEFLDKYGSGTTTTISDTIVPEIGDSQSITGFAFGLGARAGF